MERTSKEVEKLTDQNVLADIAKNDKSEWVRRTAVEMLTDQNVLLDFAINDVAPIVRTAAVKKLTDQEALAGIAKNDTGNHVRTAATEKLTDQRLLMDIVQNDKDSYVRRAAVKKLTDQNVLADIAKNDEDASVRASAVEKLADQNVLADIAKNDDMDYVRRAAAERLDDKALAQGLLEDINHLDEDEDEDDWEDEEYIPVVKFQKIHPEAVLPSYAHPGDAGMDVCSCVALTLQPGARALVPTGLVMELPEGTEAQMRPRSGLALKHGITLLNTPGTIDEGYRGELGIILINHGQEPFNVTPGMRIAQMVIAPVLRVDIETVAEVSDTTRGAGGFGSTGV